jgi:hypothetical protein
VPPAAVCAVLDLFPFLAWLAAATSAVGLVVLWRDGETRPYWLWLLTAWFVLAACCQFLSGSGVVQASGLAMQTLLAVGMLVRFRAVR